VDGGEGTLMSEGGRSGRKNEKDKNESGVGRKQGVKNSDPELGGGGKRTSNGNHGQAAD